MLYFLCKVSSNPPPGGKNVFDFIEIYRYNDKREAFSPHFLGEIGEEIW